jgi:hypothetical protein
MTDALLESFLKLTATEDWGILIGGVVVGLPVFLP